MCASCALPFQGEVGPERHNSPGLPDSPQQLASFCDVEGHGRSPPLLCLLRPCNSERSGLTSRLRPYLWCMGRGPSREGWASPLTPWDLDSPTIQRRPASDVLVLALNAATQTTPATPSWPPRRPKQEPVMPARWTRRSARPATRPSWTARRCAVTTSSIALSQDTKRPPKALPSRGRLVRTLRTPFPRGHCARIEGAAPSIAVNPCQRVR